MSTFLCPCGTKKSYDACCGQFIEGMQLPNTPEALMRSRYTAYSLNKLTYIKDTMKPPAFDKFTERSETPTCEWVKLKVIKAKQMQNKGQVEFKAFYVYQNKRGVLHELSEFHLIDGKWFYVDGKLL